MKPVQAARAPWREVVLVCSKCARKAGAKAFRKDLRRALKQADAGKRIRLAETSCLDLCPKRRVVVAFGRDLAHGRLLVAAPDAADAVAAALVARIERPPAAIDTAGAAT